jgi:hypothetical protein
MVMNGNLRKTWERAYKKISESRPGGERNVRRPRLRSLEKGENDL